MSGLQSLAPEFSLSISVTVCEDLLRLCERAVRVRLNVNAIFARTFFDVQTDTPCGAIGNGRQHVIGAHRGIESVAVVSVQLYRFFIFLHQRLTVFVLKDRGASLDFVCAGFQTNELFRNGRSRCFRHIGVGCTRHFGEGIVNLVDILKILRHIQCDLTVVLTLHLIFLRIEGESSIIINISTTIE